MKIRNKIILIVLPLILTPIILTGIVSSLSARNGISIIANNFLKFKIDTLSNYAQGQWNLLKNNNFDTDPEFVRAAEESVAVFSESIIRNNSEIILAVDYSGNKVFATRGIELTQEEKTLLIKSFDNEKEGWQRIVLSGEKYIAHKTVFDYFSWYVLAAEKETVFYSAISDIYRRTFIILTISVLAAVILLVIFSNILTKQLVNIVGIIKDIISTGDLSKKVTLKYKDETGQMGHYFNLMTDELGKAYDQIKKYAYEMVLAKNNEKKIRNIFQKYVPKNVIDQFEVNPETMLKGDNRELSILFSDIRSFTSISEKMTPAVLVESLNNYFEKMVDIIINNNGIVDKYIGDAIMAFFGAPVKSDNDALKSVQAGLGMMSALSVFNSRQTELGLPHFNIGIGINYGEVVIGNIGSDKKMDYTVIGDMVNLASRLESLTKYYREPIIISQSIKNKIADNYPCRLLDKVVVKGKSICVDIYTVRESLTEIQKIIWELHETAMKNFYKRNFLASKNIFIKILEIERNEHLSEIFVTRCDEFIKNPPPDNWKGENILASK